MNYYISDLHLGYEHIIEMTGRPFASVEEMDETLISNWNETVNDSDDVYLVGDVSLSLGKVPVEYVRRLAGHIHLIRGNHDTGLDDQADWYTCVDSVHDFWELDDGDKHIILCHYPMIYEKRGYMIHGHLHNTRCNAYYMLRELPHVLNCGVDVNGFHPVTLQQLIENNELFYSSDAYTYELPQNRSFKGRNVKPVFNPVPERTK